MEKKLYRSSANRKLVGVCGGIAEFFGLDATIVRLIFALTCLAGGAGLWVYIICALIIPERPYGGN